MSSGCGFRFISCILSLGSNSRSQRLHHVFVILPDEQLQRSSEEIWNSECEENCPENKTPFVKTTRRSGGLSFDRSVRRKEEQQSDDFEWKKEEFLQRAFPSFLPSFYFQWKLGVQWKELDFQKMCDHSRLIFCIYLSHGNFLSEYRVV